MDVPDLGAEWRHQSQKHKNACEIEVIIRTFKSRTLQRGGGAGAELAAETVVCMLHLLSTWVDTFPASLENRCGHLPVFRLEEFLWVTSWPGPLHTFDVIFHMERTGSEHLHRSLQWVKNELPSGAASTIGGWSLPAVSFISIAPEGNVPAQN